MSRITREQFIRGIRAIQRHIETANAVRAALKAGGIEDTGVGQMGDPLLFELTSQIEERCGDINTGEGTMIEYMLYDQGGPVTTSGGTYMVQTPEELWAYWKSEKAGPFAPPGGDG